MSERPRPQLDWSMHVECPQCKEDFDAVDQDMRNDSVLAQIVFNNRWDDAAGHELTCPNCEHEFEIGSIEY